MVISGALVLNDEFYFTYFFPIAKTPYKAALIITQPQPTNVEISKQNMIGKRPNLQGRIHKLINIPKFNLTFH